MKYKHLAGIGFATIFGLSFLFSKQALNYVSPMGLIAYRFLIAWILFVILILFKIVKIQYSKHMIKYLILTALFQPVIYFIAETYGLMYISSGESGLMIALIPIFVTLLSAWILKEKPKKIQYLFIFLSFIGVIIIQVNQLNSSSSYTHGYILLFIAVIAASLFNISSRYVSKEISPQTSTFFMTSAGALVFNIIYLLQLFSKGELNKYILNLEHIELLLPILYLSIFASVLAFFLVNLTLKHMEAHVSSIYSNISTVIALIAGMVILHEHLYIYHYIGALLIIIGVYGTVKFQKNKRKLN